MLMSGRTRILSGILAVVTLLFACSDDGASPEPTTEEPATRDDITRAFSATTFTTRTDGTTTDELAEGATLDITLHEDGTTTGNVFVPEGAEEGDLDADLSGTFSFNEPTHTVTFDHSADTFVRDMTFSAVRADGVVRLRGEETFSGTTVRVVLE